MCVFLYGTFYNGDDHLVDEICDENGTIGSMWACPVCEFPNCEFEKLASGCFNAGWDYRMDNEATPVRMMNFLIFHLKNVTHLLELMEKSTPRYHFDLK